MKRSTWRPATWPGGLVALTIAASSVGCGNASTTTINGRSGLTVDESGRPLIVAEVCTGVVTEALVAGPYRDGTTNEVMASLRADQALSESFLLNPSSPGSGWSGSELALPLRSGLHIVVLSSGQAADSQLSQVSFQTEDPSELRPGVVQYGNVGAEGRSERVSTDEFRELACAA